MLLLFLAIINMAWQLQQTKAATKTSRPTDSRSKLHFQVKKTAAQVEQTEHSKRHEASAAECKARHKGRKYVADVSKHQEEKARHTKHKASSGDSSMNMNLNVRKC